MPRRTAYPSFHDMVALLREEFEREDYVISDIYEEDPDLPVDLFCTKRDNGKKEFCFVIVAALDEIPEEFQRKLFFYQYFLSLHYKLFEYRIILAVPASANVVT